MGLCDALKGNVTFEKIRPYVMSCLPDDSLAYESCIADLELASVYLDCTYFILRVINTELLQIQRLAQMKLSDDVRLEAVRFLGNGRMNRLAEIRLLADHIIPIFDPDPENKLSQTELEKFPTSWSRAVCHAVLGLIHKGDLNYPRLYIRLYRLLDETLFECPDAKPFLIDLDIYLSSIEAMCAYYFNLIFVKLKNIALVLVINFFLMSLRFAFLDTCVLHLATAVVASFIKRLSQLSILSPISLTPAILLIIFNGLQRHPHCRILIDCKEKKSRKVDNKESDDNILSTAPGAQSIGDPYKWDAETFESSGALESSLWEVSALISHYSSEVSSLANKICNPDPTDPPYDLSVADILDKQEKSIKETKRSVKEALYLLSKTNITIPDLPPLEGWT
ncbi:hypothetical protein KSF78_0001818 [Schistosoma japonicum]|nr:hypothetical protein KSF78_0001818 [Schistosoma japonicum]